MSRPYQQPSNALRVLNGFLLLWIWLRWTLESTQAFSIVHLSSNDQITTDAHSEPLSVRLYACQTVSTSKRIFTLHSSKTNNGDDPADDWNDDNDDDGWGMPTPQPSTAVSSPSLEGEQKLNELRSLQNEASMKSPAKNVNNEPTERDTFIPIMALVSLAGLFGAYGYETLRLASRGELYLPFGN